MERALRERCIEMMTTFGVATDLESKLIDARGKVIETVNDECSGNCICIQVPGNACRASHLFGARQSLEFGGSYIFFCPIGLVHFVSPIICKGKMEGAIISGHFLMTEPDIYLLRHIMKYVDDEKTLKDFTQRIRVFEPARVKALAEMLRMMTEIVSDGTTVIKTSCMENLSRNEKEEPGLKEAKHQHSIHKVINHIKANYMNKVSLEEVAMQVHFTPQYMSKIFREETGQTFKQYLTSIRVEKSKKLLMQGDIPHSEVAYLTGFSDQSHYSKSFKKITGISPKTFQLSQMVY